MSARAIRLMFRVVEELKFFDRGAILEAPGFSYDSPPYWDAPEGRDAIEQHMATRLLDFNVQSWAFGVRAIWDESPDNTYMRSPQRPPLPGEQEILWLVGVDLEAGVDIGHITITRTPEGQPIYGDLLVLNGEHQLQEGAPGFTVLRTVLAAIDAQST